MNPVVATPAAALDATTSGHRMLIASAPNATTLLSYAALVQPDPLQVGVAGSITLAVSNPTGQPVTVTSIQVTLSAGTAAKDLSSSLNALGITTPADWSATNSSGVITLTPKTPAAGQVGRNGLAFVVTGFTVNGECGITPVFIDETASSRGQPQQDRTASVNVPKFPAQFFVGDLSADPSDVSSGDTTTLNWTGSGGPSTSYLMVYVPSDTADPVYDPVGNTGPYATQALTRTGAVVFNLIVSVKVDGQDAPLVVHRQTSVTIEKTMAAIVATPMIVGVNGLVHLAWSAARAVSCTIDPAVGGSHDVGIKGDAFVTLASTRTFTLTAYDESGSAVQSQVTISVDPSIKPNQQGQGLTGAAGANGADGGSDGLQRNPGLPGSRGSDAQFAVSLAPIDSSGTPASVIPVTVTGGAGGKGGDGGVALQSGNIMGERGGDGGAGGNASLAATIGTTGTPAQYIVVVAGGAGGQPGKGQLEMFGARAPDGNPGTPGVWSATVNGLPLRSFP